MLHAFVRLPNPKRRGVDYDQNTHSWCTQSRRRALGPAAPERSNTCWSPAVRAETSKPKSKNPETTTGSLGLIMFFSHTILRPVQARSQCASARTSCRSGTGPSPNSAAGGQLEERRRTPLIKDAISGSGISENGKGESLKGRHRPPLIVSSDLAKTPAD